MNELIQELAERARHSIPDNTFEVQEWIREYNRIFAQLILKECSVALSPMLRDMIGRGQAVDLINKHFGVEE